MRMEDEFQKPRPASEFYDWANEQVKNHILKPGGRRDIIQASGDAKFIIDELWPIGLFARHHFKSSPDVIITPIKGSQDHDARVEYKISPEIFIEYIEVTQAHEGEEQILRNEYLLQKGYVNPVGKVTKTKVGTKVEINVESNRRTRAAGFFKEKQINLVSQAARRKAEKPYPPKTALVIKFDDSVHGISNKADLHDLESAFRNEMLPKLSSFVLIALVGEYNEHYLEFPNKTR